MTKIDVPKRPILIAKIGHTISAKATVAFTLLIWKRGHRNKLLTGMVVVQIEV